MYKSQQHKRAAFMTGSAGQIGQKLCESFAISNKSIIGLYRSQLPKAHKEFLPLCCDLKSADSIVAPLKTTDCVIHLAWQGGVLGALNLRGKDAKEIDVKNSYNVEITRNLIDAMEKAGTRRIVFLSWVGADRNAANSMLREKYWAENVILNSSIPEKIILRAGVVTKGLTENVFYRAVDKFAKIPMVLPLPKDPSGIVMTSMEDIIWGIENAIKINSNENIGSKIIDLTSTSPESGANIVTALATKLSGKRRLTIGGVVGDLLFKMVDRHVGRANADAASLSEYFEASTIPTKCPAEGIPPAVIAKNIGNKVNLADVF